MYAQLHVLLLISRKEGKHILVARTMQRLVPHSIHTLFSTSVDSCGLSVAAGPWPNECTRRKNNATHCLSHMLVLSELFLPFCLNSGWHRVAPHVTAGRLRAPSLAGFLAA
jgi:hypothetical protein